MAKCSSIASPFCFEGGEYVGDVEQFQVPISPHLLFAQHSEQEPNLQRAPPAHSRRGSAQGINQRDIIRANRGQHNRTKSTYGVDHSNSYLVERLYILYIYIYIEYDQNRRI